MRRRLTLAAALALAGAGAVPAAGQLQLSPRSLGMAGAYAPLARGHRAVFLNPAQLALPGGPRWSLGFPQVVAGATLMGAGFGDLPDYDDLEDERKAELLDVVPAGGAALDVDVAAPLLAVQRGSLGIGVAYRLLGEHTVGRDVVELLLYGYDPARLNYRVGETAGSRASLWDFAVGYGLALGPATLGATGHYYRGGSLARTRAFEPRYRTAAGEIEVDYVGVSVGGGNGFGVDLGAALRPAPGVTLSASVANLVSSLDWGGTMRGRMLTLTSADFEAADFPTVRRRYDDSEQELAADPPGRFGEVARELEEARLPARLRLGAAWSPLGGTELGSTYEVNLTDGELAGRWSQLLALGVQQKLPGGTARLGIAGDWDGGRMYAGGLSLGPLELGLARFTTEAPDGGGKRRGWIASFGLSAAPRPAAPR